MRHRGYLPKSELKQRSQLARTVHRKPFLQGSIVKTTSQCGKDNCWCTKTGKGHPACYLSIRVGTKRKMIYIPKKHEKQIREWVKTYKEITKGIMKISKSCLDRFKKE